MVKVDIRGKEFPLCLTVAALDKINDKCGGLKDLTNYLTGGGDLNKAYYNTAWLLSLLIAEGEKNRVMCAQFDGEPADPQPVPDYDTLCTVVNIGTMMRLRSEITAAIQESISQEIEAEPSKNVENAGQG